MADGDADIPGSTRHGNNTQALELFCRPFAERFKVSTTHMMHRLLGLGLILLEIPEQLELFPDIWPPALVASPFQQGACCLVSSRQVTELVLYKGGL